MTEGTPFILVGTKSDLLEDEEYLKKMSEEGISPITTEMAESVRSEVDAICYVDCSAKTSKGIRTIFEKCIDSLEYKEVFAKTAKSTKKDQCCIII